MGRKHFFKIMLTLIFVVYGCVLIYYLFFAEGFGRKGMDEYSLNLIPFKEIKRFVTRRDVFGTATVFLNVGGNVLAFVPFGLFIVPIADLYIKSETGIVDKFTKAVILTFDVSLSVEIIQLVSRVGRFDVDDLMLNTLGGAIGAGLFALYSLSERKKADGKA
jgi:glycopeptide antibiotics resistance protein